MFASAAVLRVAGRQAMTGSTRRQFSAVATKTLAGRGSSSSSSAFRKNNAAPFIAAAGLATAAALFQQREVSQSLGLTKKYTRK